MDRQELERIAKEHMDKALPHLTPEERRYYYADFSRSKTLTAYQSGFLAALDSSMVKGLVDAAKQADSAFGTFDWSASMAALNAALAEFQAAKDALK